MAIMIAKTRACIYMYSVHVHMSLVIFNHQLDLIYIGKTFPTIGPSFFIEAKRNFQNRVWCYLLRSYNYDHTRKHFFENRTIWYACNSCFNLDYLYDSTLCSEYNTSNVIVGRKLEQVCEVTSSFIDTLKANNKLLLLEFALKRKLWMMILNCRALG